ncbi:MAG: endolytic transglycosylase MltG, partial [Patescibacteria group bacterium]|nr:endolytic transglycosylase MltG [Patescibacteria group bacterium]
QIAENLTHGTFDVWITIPEGKRATEIAEILSQKLSSYNSSFATVLATKEGYLFPDTYSFPTSVTLSQIMQTMEDNFNKKYAEAAKNKTVSLTQAQVVNLASIVEREAITPHDMQYVASVLENRLNIGMPLGSDVTLEYALGYQPAEHTWWKKDLTADDLTLNSPYNTRLNAGLPPTPISNPGLTALEAVLNPPQSDYLYYISDSKGVLHFAKTLEEHNTNVKKYIQ